MSSTNKISYERPVPAKLMVRLENGEEWEATAEDLKKFRYVDPSEVYKNLELYLYEVLAEAGIDKDITETGLNPMRYAIECALFYYPHVHGMPQGETIKQLAQVAALEFE